MRRLRLRWALGVLTFPVGTSADVYPRTHAPATDRTCATSKCRPVFAADQPSVLPRHPAETIEILTSADSFE